MLIAQLSWAVLLTPFGIPIVAIVSVFTWLIVASIAEEVGKVMRNRNDTDLKLELMARGMTAEEITRVVEAGRESDSEGARKRAQDAVFN